MTDKNIFIKFLTLNISDFNLFFMQKLQTPEKGQPLPSFLFSYCLSRNTLSLHLLLLWWIVIIKIKQISSFNLLLVDFDFALLCICVSWGRFSYLYYDEITFMNSFISAYKHSFLFGLSWHNHVKNYWLFLFFRFQRKLSSRLVLPP